MSNDNVRKTDGKEVYEVVSFGKVVHGQMTAKAVVEFATLCTKENTVLCKGLWIKHHQLHLKKEKKLQEKRNI